jgi:hypothetical protein
VRLRRSRRRLATASIGVAAAAVASVVIGVSMLDASPGAGPTVSPNTPYPTTGSIALDCRSDKRHLATYYGSGLHRRTPHAVGTVFTNPVADEYAVVEWVRGSLSRVALFRGNGTAWAEVDLEHDAARGWWSVVSINSCEGRYVRKYWQHQDGVFD